MYAYTYMFNIILTIFNLCFVPKLKMLKNPQEKKIKWLSIIQTLDDDDDA